MTDRQGIEIDYCPQCRGVWLDRGELDKIIERSALTTQPRDSSAGAPTQPLNYAQDRPRYDDNDRDYDPRRKKKKRGGFLEDLFDFD
jgi:Zn-finger nucleic acid-binding protein